MDKKFGTLLRVLVLLGVGVAIIGWAQNASANPGNTIYVTTQDDEINSDGDCSLREAIQAANQNTVVGGCSAGSGADIINIPAGTYTLAIAGTEENANQTGDLDILESVAIIGAGSSSTIINGNQLDRVFHISSSSVDVLVTISNITVRNGKVDNVATGGAGILVQGSKSTLNLQSSVIEGNQANYNGSNTTVGGGLNNFRATLVVTNCAINNNTADRGGGIYTDGDTEIFQSAIYGNIARDGGGGVDSGGVYNGTTQLVNVTISNNTAPSGAGIFNDITISLLNVTLVYNGLGSTGAGFSNTSSATIKNSIIAFNSQDRNTNCGGSFTSNGHNLENAATCGFTQIGDQQNVIVSFMDENLQDNGGPTFTHALLQNSLAIDAGDDTGCPSVDQRGSHRPTDGDRDGFAVCDIGAFEAPMVLYLPVISK